MTLIVFDGVFCFISTVACLLKLSTIELKFCFIILFLLCKAIFFVAGPPIPSIQIKNLVNRSKGCVYLPFLPFPPSPNNY